MMRLLAAPLAQLEKVGICDWLNTPTRKGGFSRLGGGKILLQSWTVRWVAVSRPRLFGVGDLGVEGDASHPHGQRWWGNCRHSFEGTRGHPFDRFLKRVTRSVQEDHFLPSTLRRRRNQGVGLCSAFPSAPVSRWQVRLRTVFVFNLSRLSLRRRCYQSLFTNSHHLFGNYTEDASSILCLTVM